ncbi:MAG: MerR family transcriptional regulator [Myxococcota bacterium]
MEYRVEELARAAGVRVDTVRFYQTRGLLPPPERRGRAAIYTDAHLERLRRVRALNRAGLTLDAVGRILRSAREGGGDRESLLGAVQEAEGERSFTRAELAQEADVPEFLLDSAEQAGLLQPLEIEGEPRYTEADLGAVRAGMTLLRSGLTLQDLLPLAQDHAAQIREIADRAIELFDCAIRSPRAGEPPPTEQEITRAFRELLPAVTTLVALHFQRTLLHRARARLARSGENEALRAALDATLEARLKVSWS